MSSEAIVAIAANRLTSANIVHLQTYQEKMLDSPGLSALPNQTCSNIFSMCRTVEVLPEVCEVSLVSRQFLYYASILVVFAPKLN